MITQKASSAFLNSKSRKSNYLRHRLYELKKRTRDFTDQVELEDKNGLYADEGMLDRQQLLDEIQLLRIHSEGLKNKSDNQKDESIKIQHAERVGTGKIIYLQNSTYCIRFELVRHRNLYPTNQISTSSPIGSAVLGKKVGDFVYVHTPHGINKYSILRIL